MGVGHVGEEHDVAVADLSAASRVRRRVSSRRAELPFARGRWAPDGWQKNAAQSIASQRRARTSPSTAWLPAPRGRAVSMSTTTPAGSAPISTLEALVSWTNLGLQAGVGTPVRASDASLNWRKASASWRARRDGLRRRAGS